MPIASIIIFLLFSGGQKKKLIGLGIGEAFKPSRNRGP
jgi:hypothetical protein